MSPTCHSTPERFSPLGTPVLSALGLWWEVETPVYIARLPLPWILARRLDGRELLVDWQAGPVFTLKTPRIPSRLLAQAAVFFAQELEEHGGQVEALAWLTWSGQKWALEIPPQEQSDFRVKGEPITPDNQVGMVVHSHGNLPAFFSPTDDASEQDGFLYGVVGGLASKNWSDISLRCRAGHAGCCLPLGVRDVFAV